MTRLDKSKNLEGGKKVENGEGGKKVENGEGIIKNIKKTTGALALTIALGVNPANATKIVNSLKGYEDACLNSSAGEKVTILVSQDFYTKHREQILKSIPQEDMCELEGYDKKTNSVNFPVKEKNGKKYLQISFKPGEWNLDASDIVAQEEQKLEKSKKELEKSKKELEKSKQKLKDIERLAKMNPTRELEGITIDYKKKFFNKGKLEIDKYYKAVKEAHQAIVLPSSYIDTSRYNMIIKSGYLQRIINSIEKYMQSYKGPENKKSKIGKIIKMLKDIKDKSKSKNYGLA